MTLQPMCIIERLFSLTQSSKHQVWNASREKNGAGAYHRWTDRVWAINNCQTVPPGDCTGT